MLLQWKNGSDPKLELPMEQPAREVGRKLELTMGQAHIYCTGRVGRGGKSGDDREGTGCGIRAER